MIRKKILKSFSFDQEYLDKDLVLTERGKTATLLLLSSTERRLKKQRTGDKKEVQTRVFFLCILFALSPIFFSINRGFAQVRLPSW